MKRKILRWVCIGAITLGGFFTLKPTVAKADLFGGDLVFLAQILAKAIQQVAQLQQIIGVGRDTVSILQEMNRGVKDVLRLAETAHVPLPKQIYEDAKKMDQAIEKAQQIYGIVSDRAPLSQRIQYKSGVEGLFLSQDAFDYSTQLDKDGERVKSAAIVSNQATATRLTAETLGVLLHAVSHTNRLLAKNLEISSTTRVEQSAKENAQFETFIQSHEKLESDLNSASSTPLNSFESLPSGNK